MSAIQRIKVEVSIASLLKVVGVIVIAWFLYTIRDILAVLFVSLILASAFDPFVNAMAKWKIPRVFGITIIYIVMLAVASGILLLLVPPVTSQLQQLSTTLPQYWQNITQEITALQGINQINLPAALEDSLEQLGATVTQDSGGVFATVANIFGGIAAFVLTLVITFYLLIEQQAVKRTMRFIAPDRYHPYLLKLFSKIRDKIGMWLRGQIMLSLIIGAAVFIGLEIFGIFVPTFAQYALALALFAFLMEFIPYLGPILSAVPAVFIGFTQSLTWVLIVIAFYVIIQWLENNLIVPQVMRKAVGLNPIIVIIALLIGARIGGVAGMILAIPVTTALSVVIEDVYTLMDERELEKTT